MPEPSLRIVRRPKGRRALTAAATPVTDPNQVFRTTMGSVGSDWQTEAWDLYDQVGELRYYVGWRSASCSRVRLVASDVDPETGLPTGSTENATVNAIVNSIADGALGQAKLIKRTTEVLTVPGEVWIAIVQGDDGRMRWLAITKEEMHRGSRGVDIDLPEGGRHRLDMSIDSLIRVWNPRARRANEADSPVRACRDPLWEIVRTTKTISNANKSRLIGNGVLFVPNEMSLPPVASTTGVSGSEGIIGPATPAIQQLQELLWQVANTANDDEDSMAALVPIIAAVNGDQIKNVSHLKFDNTVTEMSVKVRNDAISRLAMGLDMAPERLLGIGSNTNHWSAWQLADEDVQLHIAPVMETFCQAINDVVLRKVLTNVGLNPDAYVLWYDASALTADPDNTDNALAAFDRGAITAEALVKMLNLPDDGTYDFTSIEGWQRWAEDRVSDDPTLVPTLAPLLPITELYPELSVNYIPGEPPPDDGTDPALPPGQSEPGTENNPPPDEPAPGARASSEVFNAIVDLMVGRALELAGKRRRLKSDHERLRNVPMHETHRYMPPVKDFEVGKLTHGWDAALEDEVLARVNLDPDVVRAAVARRLRQEMTATVVDA